VKLQISESKKAKPVSVDIQASLSYARRAVKEFDVVAGDVIALSGTKYKVSEVKAVDKGAEVTLENVLSGKKRTLRALEQ